MKRNRANTNTLRTLVLTIVTAALLAGGHEAAAQSGIWEDKAPMPVLQAQGSSGAIGGTIYAAGGYVDLEGLSNRLFAYDAANDIWTEKANLPGGRANHGGAAIGTKLYAVGGDDANVNFNSLVEYDSVLNTWSTKNPMTTERSFPGVTEAGSKLYVIGGTNPSGVLDIVEEYNPATDFWETVAPLPQGRMGVGATSVNGIVYAIGGAIDTGGQLQSVGTVTAYDPTNDTWMTLTPMPTPRITPAVAVLGGKIYAIGGSNVPGLLSPGIVNTVEVYDPATDTWSQAPAMPTARHQLGAEAFDGRIYAFGGLAGPGNVLTDKVEAFTPPAAVLYLHAVGASLTLDSTAPTAATAQFRDSPSLKFAGGNPWKQIGTWNQAPAGSPRELAALGDLHVWLGLKNSDDQGTRFDVRAEVLKNGVPIASGEIYCVTGVTRNPAKGLEIAVPFGPIEAELGAEDVLSLRVLARVGTDGAGAFCGGHSNAVGLRLYFDSVTRRARFDTTSP